MHSTRPLTRLVLVLVLGLSGAAGAESAPGAAAGSAAKPGGIVRAQAAMLALCSAGRATERPKSA